MNPVDEYVNCKDGVIYFPIKVWEETLQKLMLRRPALVPEFKRRSIKFDTHYVVIKEDQCLFYNEGCLLKGDLEVVVGTCSCQHQKE